MRQYLFQVVDFDNRDRWIGKFYGEYDGIRVTCIKYSAMPGQWFLRPLDHFTKER